MTRSNNLVLLLGSLLTLLLDFAEAKRKGGGSGSVSVSSGGGDDDDGVDPLLMFIFIIFGVLLPLGVCWYKCAAARKSKEEEAQAQKSVASFSAQIQSARIETLTLLHQGKGDRGVQPRSGTYTLCFHGWEPTTDQKIAFRSDVDQERGCWRVQGADLSTGGTVSGLCAQSKAYFATQQQGTIDTLYFCKGTFNQDRFTGHWYKASGESGRVTTFTGPGGAALSYIAAVAVKAHKGIRMGVTVGRGNPNGPLLLKRLSSNSPFQGTDLREGHELVSINNVRVQGLSIEEAVSVIKAAEGNVVIVTKGRTPLALAPRAAASDMPLFAAVAVKPSKNAKAGTFFGYDGAHGPHKKTIVLKSLSDDSLFLDSGLERGDEIVSINNVGIEGKSLQTVVDVIREAERHIVILVKKTQGQATPKEVAPIHPTTASSSKRYRPQATNEPEGSVARDVETCFTPIGKPEGSVTTDDTETTVKSSLDPEGDVAIGASIILS